MSDDLISRKTLLEEIQSFRCTITGLRAEKGVIASVADEYQKSILQIIENQPTAFDKEKVIEELRDLRIRYFFTIANTGDAYLDCAYENVRNALDKAIEIVKKGGIE